MPELPEVETMVRGIRPIAEGAEVVDFEACPCRRQPIAIGPDFDTVRKMQLGQTVRSVTRLGKRGVLTFGNGGAVVIEPRMTGLLLIADPPTTDHLRLRWILRKRGKQQSLWFWDRRGLGTVRWLEREQFRQLADVALGPDPFALSLDTWRERLARTARPVKVALLDQKLVAGIGNLYASEILHRAKISPFLPANRLKADQVGRLMAATQHILSEAIRYEGSTLGDGTYRNALNRDGSYQNKHCVYMKAGQTCQQCRRGLIRREVQAQRSTFFCPVCQPLPRSSR